MSQTTLPRFTPGPVPIDRVIATQDLFSRPSRAPEYVAESAALRDLTRKLAESPRAALGALVDHARRLCRAESAGVSIAETEANGIEIFRWHAVSGRLAPFLNGTMPRHFSPCGEVLARKSTLLMRGMEGHYEYVNGLAVPLPEVLLVPFFQNGEPIGTVWVVQHGSAHFDAEDQRLLESLSEATSGIVQSYLAIRKLEETVADLSRERDLRQRLVDSITHDLRTPLTAARLTAQLLQRKLTDPTQGRSFDRIVFNMDRAERMIRDMLDANLVKAGETLPVNLSDCRVDDVVMNAVRDLADLHGDRFRVSNDLGGISGRWDASGIQRIVENLGTNAVKYGRAETPVSISLSVHANTLHISVHNQGVPIEPAEQERIFKPYRRTESAVKGGQKGWGLGLSLVKSLAEAHGGEVSVRSVAEEGTTFAVHLPSAGEVVIAAT